MNEEDGKMRVALASDHGGVNVRAEIKNLLEDLNI